jgi:hypothetical protein
MGLLQTPHRQSQWITHHGACLWKALAWEEALQSLQSRFPTGLGPGTVSSSAWGWTWACLWFCSSELRAVAFRGCHQELEVSLRYFSKVHFHGLELIYSWDKANFAMAGQAHRVWDHVYRRQSLLVV